MDKEGYMPVAKRQDWGTPQDLFDQLHTEFPFTLDVCASNENAKCQSFYIRDALSLPWSPNTWSGWWGCNPPYGRELTRWVEKGVTERHGVMLLPARTDVKWFQDYLWDEHTHAARPDIELRFLRGRWRFEGAAASAPFPSLIAVIR